MSSYYRAPYGTPMYYGAHGHPYYYDHGDRREIEDLNQNQKAALYNKRQINKKEGNTHHERRSGEHGQAGAHEFQRQQEYYQRERQHDAKKFHQESGRNPFAASQFQGGGGHHASRSGGGHSRGGGGGGRSRGGGGGRRR